MVGYDTAALALRYMMVCAWLSHVVMPVAVRYGIIMSCIFSVATHAITYAPLSLSLPNTAEHEVNHVCPIAFLPEDSDSDPGCFVYPDSTRHSQPRSLDALSLHEYENFTPFSSNELTGQLNSLSFCAPPTETSSRRRSIEAIAQAFVQSLRDIHFV